jgi:hypothetical protein
LLPTEKVLRAQGFDGPLPAVGVRPLAAPEVLEPLRAHLGVAHRVLNVLVTQIGLQRPRIVALVGESIAAGVPQHVGMGLEAKARLNARPLHQARKASRGEWRAAFGREHERGLGLLFALKPPQRPQFVAQDGVRAWGALLDPADVKGDRGGL